MDIATSLVYWFLMLFLQVAPAHLHQGDVYSYEVTSRGTLSVEVTASKGQELTLRAALGKSAPQTATLVGRKLTSFKDGEREMLTEPLVLPKQGQQMLLSTDKNYLFSRLPKATGTAPPLGPVEGWKPRSAPAVQEYSRSSGRIQVLTSSEVGLVYAHLSGLPEPAAITLKRIQHR